MSEERKAQAAKAAQPKRKSVGFAAEVDVENDDDKNEPKEENQYLPEAKPKPILKSPTTFDEALQEQEFVDFLIWIVGKLKLDLFEFLRWPIVWPKSS